MSLTLATLPMKATSLPPKKTGVTTPTSGRWPAQIQGSLVTKTSPSSMRLDSYLASTARTVPGMIMLKTGMLRVAWASEFPCASRSSQPTSRASPTIVE